MRRLPVVLLVFMVWSYAWGQPYTISTFAGGSPPDGIPGISAGLGAVQAVAADSTGNVFLMSGYTIFRLDATTQTLSRIAGNGTYGISGDNGPATSAQLQGGPYLSVAVDSGGNLYFADRTVVRRVSNGVITTVAGTGVYGFSGDAGPAIYAQLSVPYGLAVDSAGNLYIADYGNNRVRKVANGVITTVAGNGVYGFSGDTGAATSAQLVPWGVALDSDDNLYIADASNRIRKVSNGVITTVAGNGTYGFSGDNSPAISAQLRGPTGVAVDTAGNLYIVDADSQRIRKVSNGVITTVAGNGTYGFSGDNGPATSAQLGVLSGVALDSAGNPYITDSNRVRKVSNGVITTVAGSSGDNSLATSVVLGGFGGVGLDSAGDLYFADGDSRIRKVSNGVITTVAGNGTLGFSGDNGPATSAQLSNPVAVVVDAAGNLYIADSGNNRVRKVSNGAITTVAGNGSAYGLNGDNGPAISANLGLPSGLVLDPDGSLYISDSENNRIRKVSNGVITTVAGNGMGNGLNGDNGPALSANLDSPTGLALDSAGSLYIADSGNSSIRKLSNGLITTVAGQGRYGFGGDDGPATSAYLTAPHGLAVDSADNLYIADNGNSRVRKISNGMISTVAGNGTPGFSGDDGPATNAELGSPGGIAVDAAGKVYVADPINSRIRVLIPGCTVGVSPSAVQSTASGSSLPAVPIRR